MLFTRDQRDAIARGAVTLTFRAWKRPQARVGGRYRVGDGVIEVDAVDRVAASAIDDGEARRAGAADREALLALIAKKARGALSEEERLFRVEFRYVAEPVSEERSKADEPADAETLAALATRLSAMDGRSSAGPWTGATLLLIGEYPRTRAAELAGRFGRETQPFKADMRKLKRLGLTRSHEVGYELTSLGRALLAQIEQEAR